MLDAIFSKNNTCILKQDPIVATISLWQFLAINIMTNLIHLKRSFRKYHRVLASIVFLPLILTTLTGMATTMTADWHLNLGIPRDLLLAIHTGEIFHLQKIYPILNGLGTLGLLITGITMTGIFNRKRPSQPQD